MGTIVQKDEEARKYKGIAEGYERSLRVLEEKEETMKEEIVQIRAQVAELNSLNTSIL